MEIVWPTIMLSDNSRSSEAYYDNSPSHRIRYCIGRTYTSSLLSVDIDSTDSLVEGLLGTF